ncbi:hypothetical protein [Photobacterium damselae]|uniref:hypothetical protein n=1 Tax=Photobacterium damselae TaxID=38293 RepID=UPI004068F866
MKYGNVILSGSEQITPSTWFPKSNLLPILEWSPIFNPQEQEVTFSNGVDSFKQKIALEKLIFKSKNFSREVNSGTIGSLCSIDENDGIIATLGGGGGECFSSFKFKSLSNEIIPFRYIKPVIRLDSLYSNLKSIPQGRYTSTYSFNIKYLFKRKNGVISYRVIPTVISFEIDFNPANLLDVIPHGDGIINPVYDKSNRLISGETKFNIEVKGVFPSGIKLQFMPTSVDNTFKLENIMDNSEIPYEVKCDVCDSNIIVDDKGKLIDKNGIYYISSFTSDFNFNLDVGFNSVKAETINSGRFRDTFYIYFEPNL